MEKYESYKDSGVQWLGEIPSHWGLRRTKYVWQETDTRSEFGSEQLLSVSQYDGVREAQSDSRSESLKGYKIVKQDELVINIMLAWLGGLGVSKHEGIVSPAYCVYKLQDAQNPRFLHYLYRTPIYLAEFARHSTGIVPSRWRMYTDDFGEVLTLLPPIEEQNAMVAYLDTVTSKIDTAIAQQQKMIDLLNERKQIIINNAVTKGLNPNVKMKDSGVDWIGEIPEEWEVKKLKYCVDILPGYAFPSDNFTENGIKLLRGINVSPNKIRWEDTVYWKTEINSSIARYLLKENDLVLGLDRPWINSGTRIAFIHKEQLPCLLLQRVCRIRPIKNTSIRFIYYLLTSDLFYNALVSDTSGVSVPHISTDQVGKITMCFPSIFDQEQIVLFLDKKLSTISDSIKEHESLISLLQERKQIIINEVVTGKVKVS